MGESFFRIKAIRPLAFTVSRATVLAVTAGLAALVVPVAAAAQARLVFPSCLRSLPAPFGSCSAFVQKSLEPRCDSGPWSTGAARIRAVPRLPAEGVT